MSEPRTVGELLIEARAGLERLEPGAALAAQRDGATLIDLRCGNDREATGIIPGSIHVPLSVLLWRLDPTSDYRDRSLADREKGIVLLCADGYSSSLAAATLLRLGFSRATDVIGGVNGWIAAGLPMEAARTDRVAG